MTEDLSAAAPRVSIILNCYNGAAFLREAIESVLAQDYRDWELVCWDDQSTDASASIFQSYADSRFCYIYAPSRTPLGEARRLAIAAARGEWLAFLDQDDLWCPTKLSRQMALVDADGSPDLAIVYGRTRRFGASGLGRDYDHRHEFQDLPEGDIFPALMRQGNFVAISSLLVSRAAYDEAGGIAPGFQVAAEYYLLAALAHGRRARALQEECARYRVHGDNMSWTTRLVSHQEALAILDRWSGSLAPAAYRARRAVYQTLIGWEEIRAGNAWRGAKRILGDGSLPYLFARPFARARRAARRLLSKPQRTATDSGAGKVGWRETRRRLREDRQRLRDAIVAGAVPAGAFAFLHPAHLCVWLHRWSHYLFSRGHGRWSRLLWHINVLLTGADIHPHCDLGGGLSIRHPVGASLSGGAGRDLTVLARAGIGGQLSRQEDVGAGPGLPRLGDGVWLGSHAGVLGPVRIGDGARLHEGCIVTGDVPAWSTVKPRGLPSPLSAARAKTAAPDRHGLPITWRETLERWHRDRARARAEGRSASWTAPESIAVLLFRVSHYCFSNRRFRLAAFFWQLNLASTGADVHPASEIEGGLAIPHPAGVSLHGVAGRDLTVGPLSGFGPGIAPSVAGEAPLPELGDSVQLGAHALVAGPARVGSEARVGAGVTVVDDLAPGAVVAAAGIRSRPIAVTSAAPEPADCATRGHARLSSLWRDLHEDMARFARESEGALSLGSPWKALSALLMPGVLAGFVHRVSHCLHVRGWRGCGFFVARLNAWLHKTSISPASCIGGGLFLPHPVGIVFEGRAGRDLTLFSHALCLSRDGAGPVLGDRVSLGVHAAVLGPVAVGDDVRIAFRAVLEQDVASGRIVASRELAVRVETAERPAGAC